MTDATELRAAFEKWAFDQPDFSTMVPWDVASLAFQAGHASATQQHDGLRKDAERLDWMDANPYVVSPDSYGYLATNKDRRWGWQAASTHGHAPTLRDAVDAALSVAGDKT